MQIPLTQGKVALVDDEDAPLVACHRWHAVRLRHQWYARCRTAGRLVPMQNLILPPSDGMLVDHVNGDGLDNRRVNLREATHRQNLQSRPKTRSYLGGKTSSRFKGVSWIEKEGVWQAYIVVDGVHKTLGRFRNEEAAARAYDRAALAAFGSFAWTNEAGE